LLLRLEHDSTSIKIQSRKQTVQTDLQSKRELIKRLNQRLTELNQLDDSEEDEPESEDDDDDDENQPSYAPAIKNVSSGIDTVQYGNANPQLQQAAASLSSTLRARGGKAAEPAQDKGTASGASLFPSTGKPEAADTDTLLSHERNEQESITDSLIAMAQALKASSLQFNTSLETSDKEILDRAMGSLDKNQSGMESARSRMGALKRMTEGVSWFGRISLWARVVVLWFAAVFIVFVMPKLRF
jgi:hypothetical protein